MTKNARKSIMIFSRSNIDKTSIYMSW